MSFLASSSSVNGQKPEPVSPVPLEMESAPRAAVAVAPLARALATDAARAASAARAAAGTRRSVLANSGR
jgi:hypothetical protein